MKKDYPYPDVTIILIVFLQYRYIGDSFKVILRFNDVILPVPRYIVISGFHCIGIRLSFVCLQLILGIQYTRSLSILGILGKIQGFLDTFFFFSSFLVTRPLLP